ncbi:MAG: tetratricopeptide repeat protein [Anaerolineales bacterium]|nr:tetratricopeptide repeat protein [Anaerolineales bacterium]
MTEDSVTPNSVCKQEWTYALRYKKPVVPIRLDLNIEVPFSLGSRQWIDFSSNFDSGVAKLRQYLGRLDSPEGIRLELKSRLSDAQRDLKRAKNKEEELRIQAEIDALNANLRQQELIVKNPQKAERQTRRNIDDGIQLERQSKQPIPIESKVKFINPLPFNPPDYFQGREFEIQQLADFIKNGHQRILTIVGRAGGGKTALACYFLKALEKGNFPNDLGEAKADGIIYLSEIGSHKVNVPNIYADLLQLLPSEIASRLESLYRQPKVSIGDKVRLLLDEFQKDPVVLLLDNFELFVDTETGNLVDSELKELLENILLASQHSIKIIITTRVPARDLSLIEPSRNIPLHLDEGLKSPYAENILRAMDSDGRAGFRDANDEQLDRARMLTLGYPRALEALFAIISVDRYTSIEELLAVELPDTVVESLVGEAFSRLDLNSQKVMQALSIYNRPVPPAAVDFLLQFHIPGINSSPILNRLVGMHFARREAGRFYLHPTDREYAFNRIPAEKSSDHIGKGARSRIWNQDAMLLRAADYYAEARKPKQEWKKIDDLNSQLAEFDLLCMAEDYDTAAVLLKELYFDYLFVWGHSYLIIDLCVRVKDKIKDAVLRLSILNALGIAYPEIGNIEEGIKYYQEGLSISRILKNRNWESAFLGNLGSSYIELGEIKEAIMVYNEALFIDQEDKDLRGESATFSGLGSAYSDLGQFSKALECYEQAWTITKKIGNEKLREGDDLGNLGVVHRDLGDAQKALEYHRQELVIQKEYKYRKGISISLENIGDTLLDLGNIPDAIVSYLQAIEISDEINFPQTSNYARWGLTQAYLLQDNLEKALDTVKAAQMFNVIINNHNISTLQGIITLRLGDTTSSGPSFRKAIAQADVILSKTPEYYDAIDAKALALCGLGLIEDKNNFFVAKDAFRRARDITGNAVGITKRTLRIFNELAKIDIDGVLVELRPVIEGRN